MPRRKSPDDKPLTIEEARAKLAQGVRDYLAGHDPGPIVFRLKPTRKASEPYPLKLTRKQRESVIHCTRIRRKLKERLQHAGEGTQVIGFVRRELEHLDDELGQAALYAPGSDKQRLVAVLRRIGGLLSEDYAGLFGEAKPRARRTAPKKGDPIYQFKITLLDIEPPIWRRIRVSDCTLADLHEYLQAAFGWENYHLHQFQIDGERYESPPAPDDFEFDPDIRDETQVVLSKLIPKSGRKPRWVYEYDFGDGWRHEIQFEGFVPDDPKAKYPVCVEGERACPPEDCGGPSGYSDFLVAIADPRHPDHREMREWVGGRFDPETFSVDRANRRLRALS